MYTVKLKYKDEYGREREENFVDCGTVQGIMHVVDRRYGQVLIDIQVSEVNRVTKNLLVNR